MAREDQVGEDAPNKKDFLDTGKPVFLENPLTGEFRFC